MGQRNARDERPELANPSNYVEISQEVTTANATATVTISNVAPAEVTTATITKWLNVRQPDGVIYFIPMWT